MANRTSVPDPGPLFSVRCPPILSARSSILSRPTPPFWRASKRDAGLAGAGMFGDVLQTFLCDPVNAKPNFVGQQRHFRRNMDIHLDSVCLLESHPQRLQCATDSYIAKGGRMQIMRDISQCG